MKTLLRSTFIAAPGDSKELFYRNFLALEEADLSYDHAEDGVIWNVIKDFVHAHNHVPDISTLRVHFTHVKDDASLDRINHLAELEPVIHGDFLTRLEARADERRNRQTIELLKTAGTIISTGLSFKDGKEEKNLKGPIAAIHYILDKSHDIVAPTLGAKLSGEVTGDGVDFKNEYERVKADPLAGIGQHTGIEQIDNALNGAKRSELWIHAAFTGHLKSTFMLNWAYNQSIFYRHSSLVFSLEMPYQQCRRILYAIHSAHDKFRQVRYQLGLQRNPTASIGLPYEDIRDGTLAGWHKNAEEFLYKYVIPDFNGTEVVSGTDPVTGKPWFHPKDYGKIHIQMADPDRTDFTVPDLRHKAELIYSECPFKTIFVDHVSLMSPRRWANSTTERVNEIIRDLKKLALSFNRGQGIAVVGLFQISREGFKAAQKRLDKGSTAAFDLTHLSYANECERSSDIVTTTWVDPELQKTNRVQFQCLKSRDQKPFEIFKSRVEWPCRRVVTCLEVDMTPEQKKKAGEAVDKFAEEQLNAS